MPFRMRPQDEIDFAQGQEYASRADFHTVPVNPLEKSSNKRAARFIMNLFGMLLLLGGGFAVVDTDYWRGVAIAFVGLIWLMAGRIIFPTD